jgi:mRNA deadenylase 3'-5' endonuclease subunit Ccr4
MECYRTVQGRLTEKVARELTNYNKDLVAVQEVRWDKVSSDPAEEYGLLCGIGTLIIT